MFRNSSFGMTKETDLVGKRVHRCPEEGVEKTFKRTYNGSVTLKKNGRVNFYMRGFESGRVERR